MKKDRVELICNIGELANLFQEKSDARGFLKQVAKTLAKHMKTSACSIFLYDQYRGKLILEATEGLNQDLVGKLTLAPGDGLAGQAFSSQKPVLEKDGQAHSGFKHVMHSGEEHFRAFMAVPVFNGTEVIGILVLEHGEAGFFNRNDLRALQAIASQLAVALESARLLMGVDRPLEKPGLFVDLSFLKGQSVVEGIGMGKAYLQDDRSSFATAKSRADRSPEDCMPLGPEAFQKALFETEKQLKALQAEMEERLSDVGSLIFSTHLLMLRDSHFAGAVEKDVAAGVPPCDAVAARVEHFVKIFSENRDARLMEKVQDIKDLGHRLLQNLSGKEEQAGDYSGQIVIARELLPSELVKITVQHAEGLVLCSSGASAHISILAKSLGVPLIYSDDPGLFSIPPGTPLILDGIQGTLLINPGEKSLEEFRTLKENHLLLEAREILTRDATCSADGQRIHLRATVNLISDIKTAKKVKAEGIGLYRSEFPFLVRSSLPGEEQQFLVYRRIFTEMDSSAMVTLRTLDLGGDKILSYLSGSEEDNPFLGLRAIRFLLENKKIFVSQLKAMLRAGQGRNFRIMFPLVSSVDDFRQACRMVDKSIEFLERDGYEGIQRPELGLMIELPSAVFMAEDLAAEADFISIGSNDLVQYMLGVDRTNEKVAGLYEARHPAILRAIEQIVGAAEKKQCPLSVCGGMTFNKEMVYFLTGAGIRDFSMPPARIPEMQQFLEKVNLDRAKEDSQRLLAMNSLEEIHRFLESAVAQLGD